MKTQKIVALLATTLIAAGCAAQSATEAEKVGAAPQMLSFPEGTTYVLENGFVETYGPGEDGGPSAQPLQSLQVEHPASSVSTEALNDGWWIGGASGSSSGSTPPKTNWCCTSCTIGAGGAMTCAECHTC